MDQAIFASVQSARGGGYQLAATSSGLSAAESRELAVWGPSHDSLWEVESERRSFNFHSLQSGRLALSRSVPGAAEYSGRGGSCVHTHFLVVDRAGLLQFNNNPFAILRAASHTEQPREPIPSHLPRWQAETALGPASSPQTLSRLIQQAGGPLPFAAALDAVLRSPAVAFVGSPRSIEAAIEGLIVCLHDRVVQFSFATGLKYSPRRPARWIGLHGDAMSRRRLARQYQFALVDLERAVPSDEAANALENLLEFLAAPTAPGQAASLGDELSPLTVSPFTAPPSALR